MSNSNTLTVFIFFSNSGSDDEDESEVEIAGDVDQNEENAEGTVWSVNGAHHNTLPSQMAAAEEAHAEDEEGASGGNEKQVRIRFTCCFLNRTVTSV